METLARRVAGPFVALALLSFSITTTSAHAQSGDDLSVLIVTAHPDDDAMFAATVYKITHFLGGKVDLALVTDGSGGYRYSQLAEPIYGLHLTDETVARQYLPAIRKRELMAGGDVVGIRNYFFLDQLDHQFTTDADTVLQYIWDVDAVRHRLRQIMTRGNYDFVFVHLPVPSSHGHHKAATILALETAQELDASRRPVVLGSFVGSRADTTEFSFTELDGYPVTRVTIHPTPLTFDRTEALSEDGRLDYKIVVNWVIAEHKSQGTMQLLMNRGDLERFWIFDANDPSGIVATRALFERLGRPALTP